MIHVGWMNKCMRGCYENSQPRYLSDEAHGAREFRLNLAYTRKVTRRSEGGVRETALSFEFINFVSFFWGIHYYPHFVNKEIETQIWSNWSTVTGLHRARIQIQDWVTPKSMFVSSHHSPSNYHKQHTEQYGLTAYQPLAFVFLKHVPVSGLILACLSVWFCPSLGWMFAQKSSPQ